MFPSLPQSNHKQSKLEHVSWQGLNGHCSSFFAGCLPGATGRLRELLNYPGSVLGGTCTLPVGIIKV